MKQERAYLFGPFIGELSWEFYRFAPYAIYLKKNDPKSKIIVFTRPERFDLYGTYADILVPLKIPFDKERQQNCYGIDGYNVESYLELKNKFFSKYIKYYDVVDHFYPSIVGFTYKLKWQFPRTKMCYEYSPRKQNKILVDNIFNKNGYILTDKNYKIGISLRKFFKETQKNLDTSFTSLGCLIEFLKKCNVVVGNMNIDFCRLATLMRVPIISINETLDDDSISLLNPFKTPIIRCKSIEEGMSLYENNIRS